MSIEAKINEETQLDQAEAELSDEQLNSVTGGAGVTAVSTFTVTDRLNATSLLKGVNVARLDRSGLVAGGLLRDLASINIISNKEWQE